MKKGHAYYDPKSTSDNPIWFTVDIAFVERFPAVVPLELLKRTKGLEKMLVNQKGSRLSVQPCTHANSRSSAVSADRRLQAAASPHQQQVEHGAQREGDEPGVGVEVIEERRVRHDAAGRHRRADESGDHRQDRRRPAR